MRLRIVKDSFHSSGVRFWRADKCFERTEKQQGSNFDFLNLPSTSPMGNQLHINTNEKLLLYLTNVDTPFRISLMGLIKHREWLAPSSRCIPPLSWDRLQQARDPNEDKRCAERIYGLMKYQRARGSHFKMFLEHENVEELTNTHR